MPMWTRKDLPTTPRSGVPGYAKELFEIVEMRSLAPDYFERFEAPPGGRWQRGRILDHRAAARLGQSDE